ncbi:MAG TPA: SDR family oxidoreductase [Planctomycetes bacterium]|nr:SDR family oxidoreductase [Planctomycetota bacterium]
MSWLGLEGKTVLVVGVANRRSVGYQVATALRAEGARALLVVHTEERRAELAKKLGSEDLFVCDVRDEAQIEGLASDLASAHPPLDGIVHSVAFANYSDGPKPFHGTRREDFLDAMNVSTFSLIALSNALKECLARDASVVTISISTTRMASENYGYMAPVKAALDSSVVFLAKSFSRFSDVRFNAVRAGLLKTQSSAGIPGYVESYLFAEQATLRGRGVATGEVADTVLFLLSPRSSGINAKGIVVDAGMDVNYFDREIVRRVTGAEDDA